MAKFTLNCCQRPEKGRVQRQYSAVVMTEMVYGAVPVRDGEPVLPKWWRTIDKWSFSCVLILFGVGILLGLAASPPLAEKNGFQPFHYVEKQAFFGALALTAMMLTSMMSPALVRRLAVLGFLAAFVALILLPVFGTDFGKGAVRWYSLKVCRRCSRPSSSSPTFAIFCGLADGGESTTSRDRRARADVVRGGDHADRGMLGAPARFRPGGPDHFCDLGPDVFRRRRVGQSCSLRGHGGLALIAVRLVRLFTIPSTSRGASTGFSPPDVDPRNTQIGYATNAIQRGRVSRRRRRQRAA